MRTSSQDGRSSSVRRLALASAYLAAALMLSFAESVLFPAGILPIPGAKPGLANAAVLLCAVTLGRRWAAAVSFSRVLLSFFLFGNATSFIYSAAGAALSLAVIFLTVRVPVFSYLGKSTAAAAAHNTAQLLCAAVILSPALLALLPYMLLAGLLTGSVTGLVLNLCAPSIEKAIKGRSSHGS